MDSKRLLAIGVEKLDLAVGKSAAAKVGWSEFGRKAGNLGKVSVKKNF